MYLRFSKIILLQDDEAELDDEGDRSPGSGDECNVLPNDKCTEFILATVVEEAW